MAIKLNSGILVPAPTPTEHGFWVSYKNEQAKKKKELENDKGEQCRDNS